jgi:hypothetical protein
MIPVWPGLWKGALLKPVRYKVVGNLTLRTAENEIYEKDVAAIGMKAIPGEEVELLMPHYNGKSIQLSRYLTDIKAPKTAQGLLVRFTNLTVSVTSKTASTGTVTAGSAQYPTLPQDPAIPYTVSLGEGFKLEMSKIVFSPTQDPLVSGELILPGKLTQNTECAQAHLDLGEFRISPQCEFYQVNTEQSFGTWGVGETTLQIKGKGYVVDFSSTQTYPASGKPADWKGVVLLQGISEGSPANTVVSNIGYLQGRYGFVNGTVEKSGLNAVFNLSGGYRYGTTQPYGYTIEAGAATVNVTASTITGGTIRDGQVILPITAVQQTNGTEVRVPYLSLGITPNMDLKGSAILTDASTTLWWGDLTGSGGGMRKSFGASGFSRQVFIYFCAEPQRPFIPVAADGKTFLLAGTAVGPMIETMKIQGATFGSFSSLVVHTKDQPNGSVLDPNLPKPLFSDNKVFYEFNGKNDGWLNVVTEGVHCHLDVYLARPRDIDLGDMNGSGYVGGAAFKVKTTYNNQYGSLLLQCVESAVLNCDYRSYIQVGGVVNTTLAFKEMVFTSTANNAGGDLLIGANDSLDYWGLKLVQKPDFSSAGLISVKTGQIIMTAAGLAEYRHFAKPFWLTWGEMYPNGTMGRLFFDHNAAGQQFDKFNFIHNAVSLSEPVSGAKGFLRVGGTAYFPFFGANYLHIKDQYDPTRPNAPFTNRVVTLSNEALTGYQPTDFTISGTWQDGLARFNFTIQYMDLTQDGFMGSGPSAFRYLTGGDIGSTIDMNSRGTCIRIGSNLMDQRAVSLGQVANISNITRIWGCACIKGDAIENLVIGGEVTDAANFSVVARGSSYVSAILQLTPAMARFTLDGQAALSIMAGFDAMMNGHMQLTLNQADGFVEGEVSGKVRMAEGAVLVGSSMDAEGQLNWHLGSDFTELQGIVSMKIMGMQGGNGIGAGLYVGVNAPKSRAWVLLTKDPRYKLNMDAMPDRLTGVYGFMHVSKAINLYVISGGYDLFLGSGLFLNTETMTPYMVGNLGGGIHGEILGGLVSASASFNLQLLLGYPFGFQGTVELEGCVVWVACGSVDLTIGLNTKQGFYIE